MSRKPCLANGCHRLALPGKSYCEVHIKDTRYVSERTYDNKRGNANQRGYNYKWQKYTKRFLRRNPLCVRCYKRGIIKQSEIVDHIIPHKGNQELFWDPENHQALCKRCHDIKTSTEDR